MTQKRRKLYSALLVIGVLSIGIAALLLLSSFKAEAAIIDQAPAARTVRTRILVPGRQQMSIQAEGFLVPARSLEVFSPVAGRVVFSLGGLKGGTPVEEGEILLILDERRALLAFENARTEVIRISSQFISTAGLDSAARTEWSDYLSGLESASADRLPAMPGLDDRQTLLAATMGVSGARLAMESTALDLTDHRVYAPFAGSLSGDGFPEGSLVSPGQPLAVLIESGRMELTLSLNTDDLNRISLGDEVMVSRPEDNLTTTGHIARIEPALTAGSQTAKVHVSLENHIGESWYPGAYVHAGIAAEIFDGAYRVPRNALVDGHLPVLVDGELELLLISILAFDSTDVLFAADIPESTELVETVLQSPIAGMPLRRES